MSTRKRTTLLTVAMCLAACAPILPASSHASSPSTQPSAPQDPAVKVTPAPEAAPDAVPAGSAEVLQQRAAASLAAGDYAAALPVLRRMADLYKDDARKLKAVQQQITLCEKQLNAGNGAGQLAPEERKPIVLPKEGETLTFENIKDLGNFEYDAEKGGGIPADVKAVSGKVIRLKGYMIPMDQAESISNFALVPSLFDCCFGQPPQIQHTVIVRTPKGKAVSYYPDEIVIEGTLKVEEKKEDGFIISVFEVSATSVRPVTH